MIPKGVIRELESRRKRRVLVQLPEGLKAKSTEIAAELEEAGFSPIISGDACFGACDMKSLRGATTLHVGHSKMVPGGSAAYWEYSYGHSLKKAAEKALPLLGERVGLFTTVQHLSEIGGAKMALEKAGKRVFSARGRTTREYQLLGCDASGAMKIKDMVDSFLYIGGGGFHPIAIAHYAKKPVVAVDPFSLDAREIAPGVWEKESALRRTKAMNAQSYGIVVSSKPGQRRWAQAEALRKRLEAGGKKCLLIYLENVTPDLLLPYKVDAFAITACPRIVVDDWKSYSKPVLLPGEI